VSLHPNIKLHHRQWQNWIAKLQKHVPHPFLLILVLWQIFFLIALWFWYSFTNIAHDGYMPSAR
jgi:H+/Cl- antiporter ClcA